MKIIYVLVTAIIISFSLFFIFKKVESKKFGKVVVLNGPSGSGKSSIQKELQKLMMPHLWIKLGIDNLFDNPMPEITPENMSYWQSKNDIRWVEESQDQEGKKVITLFVGPQGEKVVYGMNSAIAAYAKNGCNVIVDYIAYKSDWLHDLEKKLSDLTAYYVAIDIPLDVLEQREAARGTSPVGHARSHYHTVYGNKKYDLRVNSGKKTPQEIAQRIREVVFSN